MQKKIIAFIVGLSSIATSHLANAENLIDIYRQAQENDPIVLKAREQFLAAQEDITQARSVLLPQLSASASYTKSEDEFLGRDDTTGVPAGSILSVNNTTVRYGLDLSMQLYHHSSWLQLDNAKKSAHKSDVYYQITKQELIIRVTEAYFNVLSAKDDLEFSKAEKKAVERQLDQTKQRFNVGLTDITDVHEAQAQYDNTITAEIRAENNVYSAEEALREITNVYPRDLYVLNTNLFSTSRPYPDSANEWQKIAEAKSLNLIVEKINIDIAKENINIAKAGHYPTLSLTGSYGSQDQDNEFGNLEINNPSLDSQSIGVSLSIPIYSGGAISSSVRQAQSNYVAASQDLEQVHRSVVRNTRNAYNSVITTVSSIKSLEQSVVSAESALRATQAGMEVGIRTIVDVLNSTQNLYNAKRNLSSTRYNYIQAILSLKQAAGSISEQDLVDISKGLIPSV